MTLVVVTLVVVRSAQVLRRRASGVAGQLAVRARLLQVNFYGNCVGSPLRDES